jgi:hypothetical protein
MDYYKLGWLLWIPGTILIVLSWTDIVSREVGWVGFAIALVGVGLSFIPHMKGKRVERSDPPPSDRGAET